MKSDMPYIKITAKDVQRLINEYNVTYFDGQLKNLKGSASYLSDGLHGFCLKYYDKKTKKKSGFINITKKIKWTEKSLRETIIHEMIHYYLFYVEGKSGGLFGHNWRFRRKAREMEKKFGLEISNGYEDLETVKPIKIKKPSFFEWLIDKCFRALNYL